MAATVQCETCGTAVTVGDEMRGLAVPCTHCQKQILIPDPEAVVEGVGGPPSSSSGMSHTGRHSADGNLSFDIYPTEADSIFVSPESISEDLFGRAEIFDPSLIQPPPAPPPVEAPPPLVVAPEPIMESAAVAAPPVPLPELSPSIEQTIVETPPQPAIPWLTETVAAPGEPAVTETPTAPQEGSHPWLQEDEPAHDEAAEQAPVERPAPRAKPSLPASFWILSILVPYALAISAFAGMLFFRTPPRVQHPLESLIDQGPYEEGRLADIEDPKRELPDDLKPLKLGESRTIGDLEVTPVEVLRQKIKFSYKDGVRDRVSDEEMLVLRLRLKNTSHPPIIFHPNDPTFVRGDKYAYTFLEVGKRRFYSPVNDIHAGRIEGQNFRELLPEESMETIVVAAQEMSGSGESASVALKKLNAGDSLVWRVQLRKGREKVEGRGKAKLLWATTVVPVTFTAGDVKEGAPPETPADEKKEKPKEEKQEDVKKDNNNP